MKLTKAKIDQVAAEIQAGNFVAVACRKCGIGRSTFYEWREKGIEARDDGKLRSIYVTFLNCIEEAEAIAEADLVAKVMKTKRGALEILKRRFRDRWGDRVVNELTGPDGRPLEDAGSQNVEVHLHLEGQSDEPWNELDETEEDGPGRPQKRADRLPPMSPPPAADGP